MKRRFPFIPFFFALLASAALFASCVSVLESVASGAFTSSAQVRITNEDAVAALREALGEGIRAASRSLSKTDGYFGNSLLRILLPPSAQPMLDAVGKIPQGQKLIDDVVLRLNRSAESAAADVVPIFVDAIQSMSIADGIAIVRGGKRAATEFLERQTRPRLAALYQPRIKSALQTPLVMNVSALKAWETLSTTYNRVGTPLNAAARAARRPEPMPAVQVDLARYATERALDGLFHLVGEEEAKIRANPLGYASAMIRKVFGAAKSGRL